MKTRKKNGWKNFYSFSFVFVYLLKGTAFSLGNNIHRIIQLCKIGKARKMREKKSFYVWLCLFVSFLVCQFVRFLVCLFVVLKM